MTIDFDEYIRQGEPAKKQRAENWQIAIGLQAVDGLTPSKYLLDVARRNIEGEISIDEASELIDRYYQSKDGRAEASAQEGIEEADKVSQAITKLLGERSFVFSVASYANVHRRLFAGVLKHAGEYRTYNITKREWVLDGDTVTYAPYEMLRETLEYDFQSEKQFAYSGLSKAQTVSHLAKFVSGIWQIHAFAEGNTRTTAIFVIQYLRSMGYQVGNEPFAQNSWYFRNALVRANYTNAQKGIASTTEYLERFFRNLLFGTAYELKNRYLHIAAPHDIDPNWQIAFAASKDGGLNGQLNGQLSGQLKLVLEYVSLHTACQSKHIAEGLSKPYRTIVKQVDELVRLGLIVRQGSKKTGGYVLTPKGLSLFKK